MAVTQLTQTNLDDTINNNDMVLIDFWAPWCGPCRMIGPVVDELAEENMGKVRVGKVNVDDNPATAAAYGIDSIPTLMIFKNGQPVDRIAGVQSKGRMQEAIDRASE